MLIRRARRFAALLNGPDELVLGKYWIFAFRITPRKIRRCPLPRRNTVSGTYLGLYFFYLFFFGGEEI